MNCTNNKVVTLGSLLAQDLPQAYILPERPSTFNHKARFLNDVKYVIHDYSLNMSADHRYLKAMRACPVAGNELPILLTRDVHSLIKEVRLERNTCHRTRTFMLAEYLLEGLNHLRYSDRIVMKN